jgi:hypothetical protein
MPGGRAIQAIAALAVTAVIGGCGGDSAPPVHARDSVIRLRMEEFRFVPQRIQVPSGPVRIIATNRGILIHKVTVESENVRPGHQPYKYGGTLSAHPGQTVTASLTLHPGKYRLSDTIGNHDSLGGYGELIVGSGH